MRVAIVHDWVTGLRGGERCLDEMLRIFPEADLFTLFHTRGRTTDRIDARPIRESALARVPGARSHHRFFLPLFPAAARSLSLSGYDLVLSSHHAVAKGVRIDPGTPHLCYCYTPMRYIWDQADAYLGTGGFRLAATPLVAALRRFDVRTSHKDHVTRFVAISRAVADRIQRHYGRDASVIHPPVRLDALQPVEEPRRDAYLLVGAFVPYKREALAIEAFRGLDRKLLVAGDGPGRAALERHAPPNVEFVGRLSDEALADALAHCRALIYPQEEDFGIIALEAQACGRPVIAFGRGGVRDTIVPLGPSDPRGEAPTGVFFDEQQPEALREALQRFEAQEALFDPAAIRKHAEQFSAERFRDALARAAQETVAAQRGEPQ